MLGIQNHLTGVMFVVRRERIFVKVAWAGIQLNSEMTNWLDQYDQNPVETRNKYLNLGYGQGLLFCHCWRCFCSSGCHVQGWIISWWTPVMDENVFSSLWHFNRCSAIYKPTRSLLNHSSTSLLNTLPTYRNIWN